MKKFLLGVLSATMVFSLSVSALAISGRMTIEVDPIGVQVNGAVFQPTDVNGNEVPVFAYNGTTYAPLRALAEAYGLEVGYDPATNMATVVDPNKHVAHIDGSSPEAGVAWSDNRDAEYQEFKAMWDIQFLRYSNEDSGTEHAMFDANCVDASYSYDELADLYSTKTEYYDRLGSELMQETGSSWVNIFFKSENGYWEHYSAHQ